jgi:hypothetical protein
VSRKRILIGVAVLLLGAAAAAVMLLVPTGSDSASAAALSHVEEQADRGSAEVLAQRRWGEGSLVLVGYDRRGERRLGLGFASEGFRGWRIASYTEEPVEPDDVVVGSLLVATSPGTDDYPAWSAAWGELIDKRIDHIEIKWDDDEATQADRVGDAYLVVEEGEGNAIEARYLDGDGTEIAKVPVAER